MLSAPPVTVPFVPSAPLWEKYFGMVSAAFALSGAEVQTIKGSGSQNVSIMDVATWGIEAFSADDDYIVVHDGVTVEVL